jgi:DNA-binding transcriptional regulator YdaS (Cro superfamily)
MNLKTYLNSLPPHERQAFGERCGTSFAYLRQIGYHNRTCKIDMAINLERESGGVLLCETLCPLADWQFIRSTR